MVPREKIQTSAAFMTETRMNNYVSQFVHGAVICSDPNNREIETTLWEIGVFSRETSTGSMNIVYFYNSEMFGLRAGDEHFCLCMNQFSFGVNNGRKNL